MLIEISGWHGNTALMAAAAAEEKENAFTMVKMLLNGGVYNGYKICKKETIDNWTTRTYPDVENRRGIGFDKKGLNPDEGVASLLSSDAGFGHSGFTGTLLWVDPEYDLVYVFLSNRTYPDAENRALITKNVRTVIHDIIMGHIMEEAK